MTTYTDHYRQARMGLYAELAGCCRALVDFERGGCRVSGIEGYVRPYIDELDRMKAEYDAGRREWPIDLDVWRAETDDDARRQAEQAAVCEAWLGEDE